MIKLGTRSTPAARGRFAVRSAVLALACASTLAACKSAPDIDESQLATDGSNAMIAASQSTSLSSVVIDAVTAPDPSAAAAQLLEPARALPWTCVTRVADATAPEVVHLTFEDCTGPFGLAHVNGKATIAFSWGDRGELTVDIDGLNLTASGKPIDHNARLGLAFPSDAEVRVIWQGAWARTNEEGETVSHNADFEVTVDRSAGCRVLDGTASSLIETRALNTVVTGYRLCRDATTGVEGCPSGTVVHTSMPTGRTVTTAYDASSVANVTGVKGNTFELSLACPAIGR